MYKLYRYNDNNFRIVITENSSNIDIEKGFLSDEEKSLKASLSRSKRMIREYALANDFSYFFTCTVNSALADRFSLTECQTNIRKIMKAIKRKHTNFKYLFITERHKDGAFHFHGLCSDLPLYVNANGYYSSIDFDKLGFNSFSKIIDKTKCANYITKYITKDCVKNEAGSVYFCSRALKKAETYKIISLDLKSHITSFKPFQNDFLCIYDIEIDKLTKDELLYLSNNIQEEEAFFQKFLKK